MIQDLTNKGLSKSDYIKYIISNYQEQNYISINNTSKKTYISPYIPQNVNDIEYMKTYTNNLHFNSLSGGGIVSFYEENITNKSVLFVRIENPHNYIPPNFYITSIVSNSSLLQEERMKQMEINLMEINLRKIRFLDSYVITYKNYITKEVKTFNLIASYYDNLIMLSAYSDADLLNLSKKITPVETTPVQTTPVQTTPVQTTPVQTTPVQTTPVETTPVQTTPVISFIIISISILVLLGIILYVRRKELNLFTFKNLQNK